jgi:hypothetical protein
VTLPLHTPPHENTMTDYRALCAELVRLDDEQPSEYTDWKRRWNAVISRARTALAQSQPVAVSERLPELRQRFESTLNGARCLSVRPVGNVQLADRLLDDVLAWSTTPPEAE